MFVEHLWQFIVNMEAQNNCLQIEKQSLQSANDILKTDNENLKNENTRLLEECDRLHSIEEEAKLLREECVATEQGFKDMASLQQQVSSLHLSLKNANKENYLFEKQVTQHLSVIAYQGALIKCLQKESKDMSSLQQQVSSLQLALKNANKENELFEKQLKRSESVISYQQALIKFLQESTCMDREEKEEPAEREGSQGTIIKILDD
jgi:hypothetical protein